MADLPALPTPGQKPWSLNPHITAMNAELNGRLSDVNLKLGFVSKKPQIFDASDYLKGDGSDDTAAAQALFNAVPEFSEIRFSGTYTFNGVPALDKIGVVLTGPGTIRGSIAIGASSGTRRDLYNRVVGITFDQRTSQTNGLPTSGTLGIKLLKCRRVAITGCSFRGMDKAIYVEPLSTAVSHDTGMLDITDNNFAEVNYAFYVDRADAVTWQHTSDSSFSDNIINLAYITAVWIKSIDGAHIDNNVVFTIAHNSSNTTVRGLKRCNVYVGQSDWLHIKGNNLFEAGEEGIWIDQPKRFDISKNLIAWPGQKVMSDGIRITGANTPNGSVTDNNVSLFTKNAISVNMTGGGTVFVSKNQSEYQAGNTTYFGTPALNTVTHYNVFEDAASTVTVIEENNQTSSGIYSSRRGTLTTSVRLSNDISVSYSKFSSAVTATTPIAISQITSNRGGTNVFSGFVHVEVKSTDTESGNLSAYLLHVAKAPTGVTCNVVSSGGMSAGSSSSANWPGFTFSINASGQLIATPVQATAGTFFFYVTSQGNIRAVNPT